MEDENYVAKERSELGDNDKSLWPIGLNGEEDDPWKPIVSLDFLHSETGEVFSLEHSAWQVRDALTRFGLAFEAAAPFHPNQYPVVELGSEVRQTSRGRKFRPTLRVVGWVPIGELQEALEGLKPLAITGPADQPEEDGDGRDEPPLDLYETEDTPL